MFYLFVTKAIERQILWVRKFQLLIQRDHPVNKDIFTTYRRIILPVNCILILTWLSCGRGHTIRCLNDDYRETSWNLVKTEHQKWMGFRPQLCTYKLSWALRTSWGWWDESYDTAFQTEDSKFEPWRSEVEHVTSRPQRLPTILTFTSERGRNILFSLKLGDQSRVRIRDLRLSKQAASTIAQVPPPSNLNIALVSRKFGYMTHQVERGYMSFSFLATFRSHRLRRNQLTLTECSLFRLWWFMICLYVILNQFKTTGTSTYISCVFLLELVKYS